MMHNQKEFHDAIENVSKEWNQLLINSAKDEMAGNSNPIVAALQPDGAMIKLSTSLAKLFELNNE